MQPAARSRATVGAASVADAFERQADARPDAVAVQLGERALTYAQLDAQANRLARRLRALGVGGEDGGGDDDVVGVVAERSPETIVAIVGTLKAGAAYTPLDPESPRMRLRRQLDAVRARAVVTPDALAERLAGAPQQLLALDPALTQLGDEDATRLEPRVPLRRKTCARCCSPPARPASRRASRLSTATCSTCSTASPRSSRKRARARCTSARRSSTRPCTRVL